MQKMHVKVALMVVQNKQKKSQSSLHSHCCDAQYIYDLRTALLAISAKVAVIFSEAVFHYNPIDHCVIWVACALADMKLTEEASSGCESVEENVAAAKYRVNCTTWPWTVGEHTAARAVAALVSHEFERLAATTATIAEHGDEKIEQPNTRPRSQSEIALRLLRDLRKAHQIGKAGCAGHEFNNVAPTTIPPISNNVKPSHNTNETAMLLLVTIDWADNTQMKQQVRREAAPLRRYSPTLHGAEGENASNSWRCSICCTFQSCTFRLLLSRRWYLCGIPPGRKWLAKLRKGTSAIVAPVQMTWKIVREGVGTCETIRFAQ